jgi:hypothetical protein
VSKDEILTTNEVFKRQYIKYVVNKLKSKGMELEPSHIRKIINMFWLEMYYYLLKNPNKLLLFSGFGTMKANISKSCTTALFKLLGAKTIFKNVFHFSLTRTLADEIIANLDIKKTKFQKWSRRDEVKENGVSDEL